ncbi:MAG: NUDIX domain-containing protein [Bacteroidetes bacterium]|nr:NUDIX domain-containing protein [Bacteroidota bacterium]
MNGAEGFSGRVRVRSCALVVTDNRLLLVKQNAPTRTGPIWLPPGGEVELGETAKEAAARETFEETGIKSIPSRLMAVHEFSEPPFHAVELYFLSEMSGGTLKVGTDPELSEREQQILQCKFIDIESIGRMDVYPAFIRQIDQDWLKNTAEVPHFVSRR